MGTAIIHKKYQLPPRTAIEVFEMLPEGTLAEVINNTLYISSPPDFEHQLLLSRLHTIMNMYILDNNLGVCVFAPVDVYLDNNNVVQPDIIFIAENNMDIIKDNRVKGAPDLVIEVLSGNKKHDLHVKKNLYKSNGVQEYFIINPKNKEVITYYHNGSAFVLQESRKEKLKSKLLGKTFAF